jgi:uncharacterized protein (TIGR04255 family)
MTIHLKHAPLIYALGMVQFPKIPGVERFTDNFLDKIRDKYPLVDEVKVPIYTADFSPQGIQMGQQESRLFQFLSIDKKWGFILTEQGLYIHTIEYQDFRDFSNRFQVGLEALLKLPDIGIQWIRAVGIRYVNLVAPKPKCELNKYIHPWVLPNEPSDSQLSILQSAYVARYKTEFGELRLQSLRNPQFTLPPELQSPLILKNEWIKERPNSDFALIDIDHSITYAQPIKIETKAIISDLTKLRGISSVIFKSIGTDFAHKAWR